MDLRPFQRRFLRSALAPGVEIAAISGPRAMGKTTLAAHLIARSLRPGDPLFVAGATNGLVAGSLKQASIAFRLARAELGEDGYRYEDSNQNIRALHKASGTRMQAHATNAKTAYGLLGTRLLVVDEPAVVPEAVWTALSTGLGKTETLILLCGTLAPAPPGHWWRELVAGGSQPGVHVDVLQGSRDTWSKWATIKKANPLVGVNPRLRRRLLRERDAARLDSGKRAEFMSLRLNLPTEDESVVLLSPDAWRRTVARDVTAAEGQPVVGIDLGGGRAWSAAVAVWHSGRIEAVAIAPGTPSIADQEKRDRVPTGTYQRLIDSGVLTTDGLRHVPRVEAVVERLARWRPLAVVCDRFRLPELWDSLAGTGVPVVPRMTRWSESSEDIRALRRFAADGPLSVDPGSRALMQASLAVSKVQNDDGGSVRMVKRGANNQARDDVASALVLAAGALARTPKPQPMRIRIARRGAAA